MNKSRNGHQVYFDALQSPDLMTGPSKPVLTAGAGFYLDATAEKYKKHYNMYSLITKELPAVLKEANLGLVRRS